MLGLVRTSALIAATGVGIGLSKDIYYNGSLSALPGGSATGFAIVVFSTIYCCWGIWNTSRSIKAQLVAVAPLAIVSLRFAAPRLQDHEPALQLSMEAIRAQEIPRIIASEQEDHRMRKGKYATAILDLPSYSDSNTLSHQAELKADSNRWWHGNIN